MFTSFAFLATLGIWLAFLPIVVVKPDMALASKRDDLTIA